MDLHRLASWLRCPKCHADLSAAPPLALRCTEGHSFDANRRGYVSLLPSGTRVTGDTADMLTARARFLNQGHYASIVDGLIAAIRDAPLGPADPASTDHGDLRIVDAGCGTGYYLGALLDAYPSSSGLAADLSPTAVSAAVRARLRVDGVVADTWSGLPLREGVADLLIDVFAPRNMPDFHRVLTPGGLLAVVAAGPDHLRELREAGRAVGIQEDKRERILAAADPLFELESESRVSRMLSLSGSDVDLLLGMGPSAHHTRAATGTAHDDSAARQSELVDVSLDVSIHVLRRRISAPLS